MGICGGYLGLKGMAGKSGFESVHPWVSEGRGEYFSGLSSCSIGCLRLRASADLTTKVSQTDPFASCNGDPLFSWQLLSP